MENQLVMLQNSGEGAGYAGGIMSAATDGIMAARKVVEALGGGVAGPAE